MRLRRCGSRRDRRTPAATPPWTGCDPPARRSRAVHSIHRATSATPSRYPRSAAPAPRQASAVTPADAIAYGDAPRSAAARHPRSPPERSSPDASSPPSREKAQAADAPAMLHEWLAQSPQTAAPAAVHSRIRPSRPPDASTSPRPFSTRLLMLSHAPLPCPPALHSRRPRPRQTSAAIHPGHHSTARPRPRFIDQRSPPAEPRQVAPGAARWPPHAKAPHRHTPPPPPRSPDSWKGRHRPMPPLSASAPAPPSGSAITATLPSLLPDANHRPSRPAKAHFTAACAPPPGAPARPHPPQRRSPHPPHQPSPPLPSPTPPSHFTQPARDDDARWGAVRIPGRDLVVEAGGEGWGCGKAQLDGAAGERKGLLAGAETGEGGLAVEAAAGGAGHRGCERRWR